MSPAILHQGQRVGLIRFIQMGLPWISKMACNLCFIFFPHCISLAISHSQLLWALVCRWIYFSHPLWWMSLNDRHKTQLWKMKVGSSESRISHWIGSEPQPPTPVSMDNSVGGGTIFEPADHFSGYSYKWKAFIIQIMNNLFLHNLVHSHSVHLSLWDVCFMA